MEAVVRLLRREDFDALSRMCLGRLPHVADAPSSVLDF